MHEASLTDISHAAAAAGAGLVGLALPRVALAAGGGGPSRDVIVLVILRGGMDGLTLCSPYADPDYAPARGNLAVPPPGSLNGSLDLGGFFGLSPAAAALMPAYQAGDLAFIFERVRPRGLNWLQARSQGCSARPLRQPTRPHRSVGDRGTRHDGRVRHDRLRELPAVIGSGLSGHRFWQPIQVRTDPTGPTTAAAAACSRSAET